MSNVSRLKTSKFLWGLAFYVPIVSLYFLNHKVTLTSIVLSQVFYSIFSLIGDVPTGILADKIGKRQALVFGYLFNSSGFIVMMFFPSTAGLFLTYSLLGFGDSFLSGSEEALLYENSPNQTRYRKNYGRLLASATLAFTVATLITGVVVARFGMSSYKPLISLTLVADLAAALIVLGIKKSNYTPSVQQRRTGNLKLFMDGLKVVKKNSIIRALTIVSLLTLSGEYFLYSVYQPYFQRSHVDPIFLGLVMSLGGLLNYFALRYGYLLERSLSLEKILLVLNLTMGVGYVAMAYFVSPFALVPLFIVLKGLFNSQAPVVSDYVNEYTPDYVRATVLSMMSVTKTLGEIVARILLAVLVGAIGIGRSLEVQGLYMIIGIIVGYWLLVKCGCTHRINQHRKNIPLSEELVN